jgi:hypothetical protein
MKNIRLKSRPDVKEAKAIFNDGKEITLTQKSLGSGGLSQSLFFEEFPHRGCRIQLRLDCAKKSINHRGDPTLDADVYEANGAKLTEARKEWHHTSKINDGGLWIYEWNFQGARKRFKLGITSDRTISGVARIVKP